MQRLTTSIERIESLTLQIIRQSLPLLQELKHPYDSDIVEGVMSQISDVEEKVAVEVIRTVALNMVADAKQIRKELPSFGEAIASNQPVNPDQTPFLSEVWSGDAYDTTGVDGLDILLCELRVQYEKLTPDTLIDESVLVFKKKTAPL